MQKNLTTGSVGKTLILFSLPFFLSYLLQILYGMADLFIVGQFNEVDCTTAVSIGSQVMHMVTVVIVGLAMGATVLIGRAVGAERKDETGKIIGTTFWVFLIVSIALAIILFCLTGPIVNIMSTPGKAVVQTKQYLRICFIGIPFIAAYNVISSIFRGLGDSKSPMYFVAIACVVNIIFDYILIGIMGLGAIGAALGTTLAQTVSVIIALIVVIRRKSGLAISKKDFRISKTIVRELMKIGVPVAVQDGFIQVAFLVITMIANNRGLLDAAAVGIVEKIIGFVFLVPSTMMASVSALAAQNMGAGKHDRGRQTLFYSMAIAVCIGLVASVIIQFTADSVVGLFTKDTEVMIRGGRYMRSYVWDCAVAGCSFTFSGYFCAYGKSLIPFVHNVLSVTLVRIPIAYFASMNNPDDLFPMGIASPAGSGLSALICIGVYIYLRNKDKKHVTS